MDQHPTYITPEIASETLLKNLSGNSRFIVTGQIGSGKTTLAKKLCNHFGLTHLHIDDFHTDVNPHLAATEAANRITGGWVAEANVWQIPQAVWDSADFSIFLDYHNFIHYRQILRRCVHNCPQKTTWSSIIKELGNMKFIYRWGNENRANWQKQGLNANSRNVIRCNSPRTTNQLIESIFEMKNR